MGDLYSEIRERSKQDYGQKFEEWAPRILVDQYSDRTHFIFELIQNAEDAGATYVAFSLYQDRLILCHNGKLFTEADIQGICGIRSTKDEPESGKIGRFGIGFKSVYAYTKTPRIYSGQYSFRICNLILPYAEENEATGDDTILILPFDGEVNPETAYNEIGDALKKYLSADVLFALCNVRNISCKIYPDESEWSVSKESVPVDNGVDKVLLTQKPTNSARKLLVFRTQDKQPILIGYELETDDHGKDRIIPTEQHYLYVFFQTAVETHQTFYIHVPFSTTPARDNVRHNEVNQLLAEKLATLFADSIRWLLKNGYVTLDFLNEVYPILDTCKEENLRGIHEMGLALLRDGLALLPTEEGGYCSIQNAMLPYAKNIADNITQSILQREYGDTACWVKADVCLGVNEHLMMYLTHHFGLPVLRWRDVLPRLTAEILEEQTDEWLLNLFDTIYSTCTGVFPISSEIAITLSTISFGVLSPAITSTNFMTGAGLKKCMPTTGLAPAPISVMEREEVLVAKIQSALQIASNSLKVCFLISMFSMAASTTRSQSPQISLTPVVIFARILSASSCVILPLAILFSKPFAIFFLPFAANSSLISHKATS